LPARRMEILALAMIAKNILAMAPDQFFARGTLPIAPILLDQAPIQNDVRKSHQRRRFAGARKRAGIGARIFEACGRAKTRHFGAARIAQGNIDMALESALRVPFGRTMADERDPHTARSTITGT